MNERGKTYKMSTTLNYDKEMDKHLNTIFGNLRALEEIRHARVSRKCEKSRQASKTQRSEPVCKELMRETAPKKSVTERVFMEHITKGKGIESTWWDEPAAFSAPRESVSISRETKQSW